MKGILPILLILLSVGLFYTYISPTYNEITILQAEEAQYIEALDSAHKLEERSVELTNRYNMFSTDDLERLEKLLPRAVDNVRLVAEIDGIGKKYGISVKGVRVQDPRNTVESQNAAAGSSGGEHRTFNMIFTVESNYDKFVQFISDLESNLRLMDFSAISFKADTQGQKQVYEVTIKTYWLP